MPRLLQRMIEFASSHRGKKLIRFTVTSGITTVVSFTSIAVLYGFRIIPGVMWSTLAGNLIGTLPAYNLNRRWTWGKRGRSHFRQEIVPFWVMSMSGIAFSQLGAWWAKHEVHAHTWSHLFNTGLVTFTNLFCFGVFWVLKLFVFNRIFRVDTMEAIEEHLSVEEGAAN